MEVGEGFVKKIKRYLKEFAKDIEVKVDTKAVEVPTIRATWILIAKIRHVLGLLKICMSDER